MRMSYRKSKKTRNNARIPMKTRKTRYLVEKNEQLFHLVLTMTKTVLLIY